MLVFSHRAGEHVIVGGNIQIKVIAIDDTREQHGSMSHADVPSEQPPSVPESGNLIPDDDPRLRAEL